MKIQSLELQRRNLAHSKKRRKPFLEGYIDVSIDGGAALLVAASLQHMQDMQTEGVAESDEEDAVNAGAADNAAAGSGGRQGKQGVTFEQLHRELLELLDVKVYD